MAAFQKRLLELKKRYLLTTSDLGVILGCHRSTVGAWERGVIPSPTKLPVLEKRITLIEKVAGKNSNPFPVPLHITQYQRKDYLLDAINVVSPRIPKQSSSAPR